MAAPETNSCTTVRTEHPLQMKQEEMAFKTTL